VCKEIPCQGSFNDIIDYLSESHLCFSTKKPFQHLGIALRHQKTNFELGFAIQKLLVNCCYLDLMLRQGTDNAVATYNLPTMGKSSRIESLGSKGYEVLDLYVVQNCSVPRM
jgi:hypothetical protein